MHPLAEDRRLNDVYGLPGVQRSPPSSEADARQLSGSPVGGVYRVCTDIAAKREVDMERARTDLQEHRLVCPSALSAAAADRAGC